MDADMHDTEIVGGRRLGSESKYGCAFQKPLLPCKSGQPLDASNPQDVTKIAAKRDLDPEVDVGNLLREYKVSANYFVVPRKGICKPSPRIFQLDKSTQDCEIIQRKGIDRVFMIQMPYGGDTTVGAFFKDIKKLSPSTFDFYEYGKHLLEAIALTTLKGVVHRDLHAANILVDANNVPRLIDFGLSYIHNKTDPVDILEFSFNPRFSQRPPEIELWLAKESGVPISAAVDRVLNEKRGIIQISIYSGQNRFAQRSELLRYANTSRAFIAGNMAEWMEIYWPLYDAWAIGNMLLSQYNNIMINPAAVRNKSLQSKRTVILNTLQALTRLSPTERVDAVVALKMWAPNSPILRMKAAQDWLAARAQAV
jgi:hypothetical protein